MVTTGKATAKAAPATAQMVLTFEFDKPTPGTLRFKEVSDRERPAIGTLYITKAALAEANLGDVRSITVTVEGSDGTS